jgi:hypothetical protein
MAHEVLRATSVVNGVRAGLNDKGIVMSRRLFIKASVAAAAIAFAGAVGAQQKTVKIGVLHSLSGTMAISERC